MAWVSVHDTVDGPKLRDLHKKLKCSKFEALGILNFLWFWGLKNAAQDGRILNADKEDIGRYLFGVGAGCKIDTQVIVDALFETGWIDLQDGAYYIHDWETWQEQWYKAIQRRESDSKRKRESRRSQSEATKPGAPKPSAEKTEDGHTESPQDNPLDGPPADGESGGEGEDKPKYSKGFEAFWEAYPRKVEKGNAYKKYQARLKDGFSDMELITAAKNYAMQCKKERTETKYIKHPKTFLSDSMPFQDYIPKTVATPHGTEQDQGNPFSEYGGSE